MAQDDLLDYLDDDDQNESGLPKQLRAKIKELSSQIKELSEENAKLKTATRTASIAEVLESKGFSSKIASFIPSDLEPTEENISNWLDENGDVFAGARLSTPSQPDMQTTAPEPPSAPEAVRKMSQAELGPESQITVPADLEARISGAKSMDELLAVLRSA